MTLPRFLFGLLIVACFSFFVFAMLNFVQVSPDVVASDDAVAAPIPEPVPVPEPAPEPEALPEPEQAAPVVAPRPVEPRIATPDATVAPAPPAQRPNTLTRRSMQPQAVPQMAPDAPVILEPETSEFAGEEPPTFQPMIIPAEDSGEPFHMVTLFFATNRALSGDPNPDTPADQFTAEDDALRYGLAEVSIPVNHQIGHLESQGFIASLFVDPNPEKHVILQSMNLLEEEALLAQMQAALELGEKSTLFYIHGFNTGVDTAARRAGQLTYDLDWKGPSFFFSWPSQDSALEYGNDQEKARGSRHELREVFETITTTDTDRIVVIAHSMGTDLLTQTLEVMEARNSPALSKITTVILAAPDINATNFRNDIVPVIAAITETNPAFNVTLYASAEDSALQISEVTNGVLRIGAMSTLTDEEREAVAPVLMVDASNAVTNFFGHTYINDNPSVIHDVYCMINDRAAPGSRSTLEGSPDPENGPAFRIRPNGTLDNPTSGAQFECD